MDLGMVLYTCWKPHFAKTLNPNYLPTWMHVSLEFQIWSEHNCACCTWDCNFNRKYSWIINPWALLISNPSTWRMLSSRCLRLNHYHQKVLNTLPWKGVGFVWVNLPLSSSIVVGLLIAQHLAKLKPNKPQLDFFFLLIQL